MKKMKRVHNITKYSVKVVYNKYINNYRMFCNNMKK